VRRGAGHPRLSAVAELRSEFLLQLRAQLDIRFTLRTDDGELVYASSSGISDIAPEVRQRIAQGTDVDPSEYYFRTALRFETGAHEYLWLNRLLAIGVGKRTAAGMETEVFAIR